MTKAKPKSTNTFGVRYLSKGRPGRGLYAVKIEIAAVNSYHGKMEYFYEGNDREYAEALANKVNELISSGGKIAALNFKDYELESWRETWLKSK